MSQSKVLAIYTGGTIGMINDPKTGRLTAFDFGDVYKHIPELHRLNCDITTITFEKPIDSSEMTIEHWSYLAKTISENYAIYDGFVVLHGSDTMSFTASALSFMLQGLKKPVILTGSQLPIGIIRTDGRENLITAMEIASARHENGVAKVQEVAIYFEYSLYRGNRTTKVSAKSFEAFQSPNLAPLAIAGAHIDYSPNLLKNENQELSVFTEFDPKVALIKLFPGLPWKSYEPLFDVSQHLGIVIETYGSGNATSDTTFQSCLENYVNAGGLVVNISQCANGSVEQGKYEASSFFNKIGVISGKDLTTEAAITKLMYVIGQSKGDKKIAKDLFEKSLAGEF